VNFCARKFAGGRKNCGDGRHLPAEGTVGAIGQQAVEERAEAGVVLPAGEDIGVGSWVRVAVSTIKRKPLDLVSASLWVVHIRCATSV
jgi:hypothetical protein